MQILYFFFISWYPYIESFCIEIVIFGFILIGKFFPKIKNIIIDFIPKNIVNIPPITALLFNATLS